LTIPAKAKINETEFVSNFPYDRPCMHECVFNDENQKEFHITTMDMAKIKL